MPGIGFTRLESRMERVRIDAPAPSRYSRGEAVAGRRSGCRAVIVSRPIRAPAPCSVGPLSPEREDRVLDVPDVLHHGYLELVALPATGGEPEADDHEPGEREEDRDGGRGRRHRALRPQNSSPGRSPPRRRRGFDGCRYSPRSPDGDACSPYQPIGLKKSQQNGLIF